MAKKKATDKTLNNLKLNPPAPSLTRLAAVHDVVIARDPGGCEAMYVDGNLIEDTVNMETFYAGDIEEHTGMLDAFTLRVIELDSDDLRPDWPKELPDEHKR